MDLIKLVAVVVVIGASVMWLTNYLEPPPPLKKLVIAATVICLALYFLYEIGWVPPNVLGH